MSYKDVVIEICEEIYDGDIPENDIQAKGLLKLSCKIAEIADEMSGKTIKATEEHTSTLKETSEQFKKFAEDSHKLWKELHSVKQKLFVHEQRLTKSGQSTKNRFEHITIIAGIVIENYIAKHPRMLNKKVCKRGVLTKINSLILDEMRKSENIKSASLMGVPTERTITKHRRLAFDYLELYDPRTSNN